MSSSPYRNAAPRVLDHVPTRARIAGFIAKAEDAIARVVAGSVVFCLKTVAFLIAGVLIAIKLALVGVLTVVLVPLLMMRTLLTGERLEINVTLR